MVTAFEHLNTWIGERSNGAAKLNRLQESSWYRKAWIKEFGRAYNALQIWQHLTNMYCEVHYKTIAPGINILNRSRELMGEEAEISLAAYRQNGNRCVLECLNKVSLSRVTYCIGKNG